MKKPGPYKKRSINTIEQVDELVKALCKRITRARDRDRLEREGLMQIRSVRMQLYFKAAYIKATDEQRLAFVRMARQRKGKGKKKEEIPDGVSKKEFLLKMLGKPLASIAAYADANVWALVRIMQAHGYQGQGQWTILQAHMIPWFLEYLPDRLMDRSETDATEQEVPLPGLPKELQGYHASTAYERTGNFHKVIYGRAKY
jgi:hypothetical protein